jgi:hypothetical protein
MWHRYTMDYYSVITENEFPLFAERVMEPEIIMLRIISQTQKDKNHIFSHMWSLKKIGMKVGWGLSGNRQGTSGSRSGSRR